MSDIAHEFQPFPSLQRLSKEKVVITEKIDGTNAHVFIPDDSSFIRAASRNRWITPTDDNYGFAKFVMRPDISQFLIKYLGPGRHYGEWWGNGIQRGYGMLSKRFSLFNTGRWSHAFGEMRAAGIVIPQEIDVVPVIEIVNQGDFDPWKVLKMLKEKGSFAAPGWSDPEGIVSYMTLSKVAYKTTFEGDKHKWENEIDQSRGQPEGM